MASLAGGITTGCKESVVGVATEDDEATDVVGDSGEGTAGTEACIEDNEVLPVSVLGLGEDEALSVADLVTGDVGDLSETTGGVEARLPKKESRPPPAFGLVSALDTGTSCSLETIRQPAGTKSS